MVSAVTQAARCAGVSTHLGLGLPLPLWIGFADKVKVFFVELFFLLTLGPTALLLPATFALVRIIGLFFLFILVYDETFSDLRPNVWSAISLV